MKQITLAIIAILFLYCPIYSQVNLEVNVLLQQNSTPVDKISVQLLNKAIGYQRQETTNTEGKAFFRDLPISGSYEVSVVRNEVYEDMAPAEIDIRANQNPSVTLLIREIKNTELSEVLIKGFPTTQINTINAEVAAHLVEKEIRALPIEGRDITRALYRLPNVSQATGFYPEAPNVSINGANSLFTNYLIDGMDNNERFLGGQRFAIPVGFTQNINVLTNNYSAEFGLSSNGVVNITTKSGSNEVHGEAFYITRPGPAIDAASPYAQRDLSGNQVKDGFMRHQAGFALGGPLVQNKTFYFINAEHTQDLKDNLLNSPSLGVNETVQGQNRFTYLSGKIDHFWSDKFRSSLRANIGFVNIQRQAGGLSGGVAFPSAGNSQDRNSINIASKNIFLGAGFSAETNLQYSRFRWNYGKADNPDQPQVAVLGPDEQTIAILGHPGYIFDSHESTFQFQEKITFYLDKHRVKTGINLISAQHSLFGGGNENGNYLVKLNTAQLTALRSRNLGSAIGINDIPLDVEVLNYNVELRPSSFGTTQNTLSLYVEDQWSVTRKLNLSYGLRYDYDNLSKGGSDKGDGNNIAPRINVNYALNGRSVLRAGYGLFYEKVLYAIYSDAIQQNNTSSDYKRQLQALIDKGILPANTQIDRITAEGNLGANASNVVYLQGPSASQLAEQRQQIFSNERRILNPSGYDNPYAHQFSLGYQLQVDKNTLFSVDVIHNRSENLFRLRDLNAPAPYPINDPNAVIVRTQAQADLSRPVPILGDFAVVGADTLRSIARNIIVSEAGGKSRFWAMTLNLQKDRGDDKYGYRLIYTLSQLENDTDDINFRAQDANNYTAEYGPSVNDRTHILSGLLYYYPFNSFTVTMATLLQSGQPINRIPDATIYGTTDLNGDGRSFGDAYVGNSDRFPGESRNNDRLPWSSTFDLALQYDLVLGKGRLALQADIFNLFNANNLSGYSNNATQSNQIQVGPKASGLLVRRNAAPPRQFQFGVTYSF